MEEIRRNNIKALREQRAEKLAELEMVLAKLEAETRAMSEDEEKNVNEIRGAIDQLDKTIKILEEVKERAVEENPAPAEEKEDRATAEHDAFDSYLRGAMETRNDVNMTKAANGDIIPQTISDQIVAKVYEISPVLEKATKYNVRGKLEIPYYPVDSADITMAYATEFTELESTSGAFDTVELTGFLAGTLTKVSQSLINNAEFDLVSFVVDHMAYNIARFIEGELLNGTSSYVTGISGATNTVATASATAITSDELVALQSAVKDVYQADACWIMNPATRTALRKLKGTDGHYLLQDDITSPFGSTLLGKPVYVSDHMPTMATKARTVIYGDLSGLAVKFTEEVQIQVLRERFATQHAVGVVGWVEFDSKVENQQKIAVLTQA